MAMLRGFLLVASLALIGFSVWGMWPEPEQTLLLHAEPADLGMVATGETKNLTLVITNQGRRPAHLIGFMSYCRASGCMSASGLPTTIAPGETYRLACQFKGGFPMEDNVPCEVITSVDGQPVVGPKIHVSVGYGPPVAEPIVLAQKS